jgi:hypothetical protein
MVVELAAAGRPADGPEDEGEAVLLDVEEGAPEEGFADEDADGAAPCP